MQGLVDELEELLGAAPGPAARARLVDAAVPVVQRWCRGRLGEGPAAALADMARERVEADLDGWLAARPGGAPFLARLVSTAAELTEGRPAAAGVPALLGRLPHRERDVLMLRTILGLSVTDTSRVLAVGEDEVRTAQRGALEDLRALVPGRSPVPAC
jgi:RNA polymerase sigma-70 factor, ECF subfamily